MEPEPYFRLAAALAAGLALGLERELRGHPAGIRTHVLVAVGAVAFTLAGSYGFADVTPGPNGDPSRIAAQVASGIGFIGAGAILRTGASVKGLTTAATLWLAASVGVLAGSGLYLLVVLATAAVLLTLIALPWLRSLGRARRTARFRIRCVPGNTALPAVIRVLSSCGAQIRTIDVLPQPQKDRLMITVDTDFPRTQRAEVVAARLSAQDEVTGVKARERGAERTPASARAALGRGARVGARRPARGRS